MNEAVTIEILIYTHLTSLSLWMGGLFGCIVIVWPAILGNATAGFPRALLATIAVRTAPWIYAAMFLALLTFVAISLSGATEVEESLLAAYGFMLVALIGNNIYGSVVAWPRMMVLPIEIAGQEWFWFRVRMSAALIIGLALYCAGIYYDLNRR